MSKLSRDLIKEWIETTPRVKQHLLQITRDALDYFDYDSTWFDYDLVEFHLGICIHAITLAEMPFDKRVDFTNCKWWLLATWLIFHNDIKWYREERKKVSNY